MSDRDNNPNDGEPAPANSAIGNATVLSRVEYDVDAAENLRSGPNCKSQLQRRATNDAEPAPTNLAIDNATASSRAEFGEDAAENLRSLPVWNSVINTHSGNVVEQDSTSADIGARAQRLCPEEHRVFDTSIKASGLSPDRRHFQQSSQRVSLSLLSSKFIQHQLETELLYMEAKISQLHRRWGFQRTNSNRDVYTIDKVAKTSMSNIIRSRNLTVEEAVKFARGETILDGRPNKALTVDRLEQVLLGYPYLEELINVAKHGIEAQWTSTPTALRPPPKNHGSCRRYLKAVAKSIREGQDSGQYLVVDADVLSLWPSVICSPLGAVQKKDTDPEIEVRTIHDLSFPNGNSTNSTYVTDSTPTLKYDPVTKIARRIEFLAQTGDPKCIRLLKSDVKGAFRHLRMKASQVFRMAAIVEELQILVVDLAAPFGWSGSPPFYSLFGRAISWLVETNSPASVSDSDDTDPFFGYEWVDDHILVEPDIANRLELAEATLRHAMLAVLGPRSINEAKFSEWRSEMVALGLLEHYGEDGVNSCGKNRKGPRSSTSHADKEGSNEDRAPKNC